ncbi:DUF2752 domain-containing protein [Nocardioides caldifontis]|uniref:DUF2752 domain-containing protein n=1 Tax=Nocardioides caldifontis TaxID=2588938 RepID=UPI0011DF521A|nr:DUF2752 domain-containing protein [Nocardioides caldifontis]
MTATAPPTLPPRSTLPGSRLRRLSPPLLLAGGLVVASVALHLRDPHQAGSWGFCPWYAVTGTYCPGCGGLRAVNDLTNGEVLAAASSNLLFVASLPFLAGAWVRSVAVRWRGSHRPLPPWTAPVLGATTVALIAVFWVVRNVPAGSWLAP